jgi:hypothetical protein
LYFWNQYINNQSFEERFKIDNSIKIVNSITIEKECQCLIFDYVNEYNPCNDITNNMST